MAQYLKYDEYVMKHCKEKLGESNLNFVQAQSIFGRNPPENGGILFNRLDSIKKGKTLNEYDKELMNRIMNETGNYTKEKEFKPDLHYKAFIDRFYSGGIGTADFRERSREAMHDQLRTKYRDYSGRERQKVLTLQDLNSFFTNYNFSEIDPNTLTPTKAKGYYSHPRLKIKNPTYPHDTNKIFIREDKQGTFKDLNDMDKRTFKRYDEELMHELFTDTFPERLRNYTLDEFLLEQMIDKYDKEHASGSGH